MRVINSVALLRVNHDSIWVETIVMVEPAELSVGHNAPVPRP